MAVVVGVGFVVTVLAVVLWSERRGVRLRGCCPADPAQDLRMRGAFVDERDCR